MKANVGSIEIHKSAVTRKVWITVSRDYNGTNCSVRLTPAQAMKIAAQLQRWAWNVANPKRREKK